MERHLHCTEQQEPPSNVSIYCACHEKWLSSLILVTYEMSLTLHGATGVTLQHHQILPLPRKMALMIESCHIRNVIYIVRSSRSRPPTSPNTAPATKNHSHVWSLSHIWDVSYNKRSNRSHSPTSPNTAPATKNDTPKSENQGFLKKWLQEIFDSQHVCD